eukprot:364418-Chlamydomonas_euryale.AAC.19
MKCNESESESHVADPIYVSLLHEDRRGRAGTTLSNSLLPYTIPAQPAEHRKLGQVFAVPCPAIRTSCRYDQPGQSISKQNEQNENSDEAQTHVMCLVHGNVADA